MTIKILYASALLFAGTSPASCSLHAEEKLEEIKSEDVSAVSPNVSIFEILANPGKYSGKEVCLAGVLGLAGKDRASFVYSSLEARAHRITVNGLALFFEGPGDLQAVEDANGKYVAILGTLESDPAEVRRLLGPMRSYLVRNRVFRVAAIENLNDGSIWVRSTKPPRNLERQGERPSELGAP